jgi:hypothetical protein
MDSESISESLRAFSAFAGGTPAVAASHLTGPSNQLLDKARLVMVSKYLL